MAKNNVFIIEFIKFNMSRIKEGDRFLYFMGKYYVDKD